MTVRLTIEHLLKSCRQLSEELWETAGLPESAVKAFFHGNADSPSVTVRSDVQAQILPGARRLGRMCTFDLPAVEAYATAELGRRKETDDADDGQDLRRVRHLPGCAGGDPPLISATRWPRIAVR